MNNKNYTYNQIKKYLFDYKDDKELIKTYNSRNPIKKKFPKLSKLAIKALAYNFIADKILFKSNFKLGIFNIKYSKDYIVVNDDYLVEVRGTNSKSGFITINRNTLKSFALIWFDLRNLFNNQHKITVYIIKTPIKFLGNDKKIEKDLSLKKLIELAKLNDCYEKIDIDTNDFNIQENKQSVFFS